MPLQRQLPKRSQKAGAPPGSLIHLGKKREGNPRISVMDYDERRFEEREAAEVEELFEYLERPTVTWVNIDGIHQTDILDKMGRRYNLHPLVLEDILNTDQRPKAEDHGEFLYIVLKMLSLHNSFEKEGEDSAHLSVEVEAEQISLILGRNFVLSFQESEGDLFDPIRERIRTNKGRIRQMKADYLAYVLIDIIVDNYFAVLETFGDRIEALEDYLADSPTAESLHSLHIMKREMIFLRKFVWPLREMINALERGESPLIEPATLTYLRDVYDHTIHVIDTIETYRDMLSGMVDTYLTSISNRTNEVMKVLTIIATIFIPLSFITGMFGMNFAYIPMESWPSGFYITALLMFLVGALMLLYFRSKHWF
ncbi:MAG: magnesium and cobalt transport protein CorA [Candidatus Abyssobacteria bacterium SURF_5]|uniref:Magnesium transport protein CorA n=1 Tax=Abyssobacteria bacterium (strain SURF_5) TaxID=2093360 RepID=A0A3A4P6F5_ABYX5|nr:MAG: magnesium and cobalt transport protein CorA [Candidatus Abyssubacteria bacterium SURF_5]